MSKGLFYMLLNIVPPLLGGIVGPGIGSLLGDKKTSGIWQLVLWYAGLILGTLLSWTGIGIVLYLAMPAAWVWALIDGLEMNKTITEKM
ncbi:MAG: hypothetical protein GY771_03095 [bacterium]|nr:hypothetical protein [bacterium]